MLCRYHTADRRFLLSGLLNVSNNTSDVLIFASIRSKRNQLELRCYLGDSGAILRRKVWVLAIWNQSGYISHTSYKLKHKILLYPRFLVTVIDQ